MRSSFLNKRFSVCCLFYRVAEKAGAAPSPAEAPATAPTKKLDNLFFIEEPKPAHVTESETPEHNTQHVHNTQNQGSTFIYYSFII